MDDDRTDLDASSPLEAPSTARTTLAAEIERAGQVGSWFWHPPSGTISWSEELFRILGYDPERDQASVEAFFAAVHPDDRERVREASARGLATGVAEVVDYRVARPDGVRSVRMNGSFVQDEKGEIEWVIGTIVDRTELLRALRALERTTSALESAQRLAHLGSWTLDAASGRLTWSDELFLILGLAPGETEPSQELFDSFVAPADLARLRRQHQEAMAHLGPASLELRIHRRDGSLRHLVVAANPLIDAEGVAVGLIGTAIDISEQRALEERLAQAEKMEAIGRLAGGVAHDFNNLLTAIKGGTELAMMVLDPEHEARRHLAVAISAIGMARELTGQLFAFARRQPLALAPIDLTGLVVALEPVLRRLVGDAIELETSLPDGPLAIVGDASKVQQIIINLAVNARDAMQDGGVLELALALGADPTAPDRRLEMACLTVTDSGRGIAPELQGRVFEPFFTTKAERGGTGLGLATAHSLVHQHGGHIALESTVGVGTRVQVWLPLASNPSM